MRGSCTQCVWGRERERRSCTSAAPKIPRCRRSESHLNDRALFRPYDLYPAEHPMLQLGRPRLRWCAHASGDFDREIGQSRSCHKSKRRKAKSCQRFPPKDGSRAVLVRGYDDPPTILMSRLEYTGGYKEQGGPCARNSKATKSSEPWKNVRRVALLHDLSYAD